MLVHLAEEYADVVDSVSAIGDHGKLYPVGESALGFGLYHLDISFIGTGNH